MNQPTLPRIVTFDGEARSGKGTIVQITKDYLRDKCGYKVMLIDRGQTFRVLVVAATRAGVDVDVPAEIDNFLADEQNATDCVQFVKDVYRMSKEERDELLYTNVVGENSAKIGARPASQEFVANLTKKWIKDAGAEGFDVVLIDGRALESIATEMHDEGLCDYRLGLYFVCDALVGARRTLGLAATAYEHLSADDKNAVDDLVDQIYQRNKRDFDREVEKLAPPVGAPVYRLPSVPDSLDIATGRPMLIIDTSSEISKLDMSMPVARMVAMTLID